MTSSGIHSLRNTIGLLYHVIVYKFILVKCNVFCVTPREQIKIPYKFVPFGKQYGDVVLKKAHNHSYVFNLTKPINLFGKETRKLHVS